MRKYFLIKYKDRNGDIQTVISKESPGVDMKIMVRDMKQELQRHNETEYPTFAIEEISEEQYSYFKKKGYYSLGE